jgi:ABC-type sugar transport system ATPase subunit
MTQKQANGSRRTKDRARRLTAFAAPNTLVQLRRKWLRMNDVAAGAQNVRKRFGATMALDDVTFEVMAGEIHALVGENGAGKSTLVRILGGVFRPDAGEIAIGGRTRHLSSPHDAIASGVVTIPQELHLVPALSVAENLALGDLPARRLFGVAALIDRTRMREEARTLLASFDFAPDPDLPVRQLGFAEQQIVALAKALRRDCHVLILDEPTAALESREIERLFTVLRRLRSQGTAVVYVSHRLEEIVELADRCTVLRDGRVAALVRRGEFNSADLVAAMTGHAAEQQTIAPATLGSVLVEDAEPRADAVRVHSGEVVGLAGLLGSGTTDVLQRFFGLAPAATSARIKGRLRRIKNPIAAIEAGIGFVPPSRRLGLIMNQSVHDNILLPSLGGVFLGGFVGGQGRAGVSRSAGRRLVAELMDLVDIRPRRPDLKVSALSGGNQQKVILAKWLARRVEVLLLDEPTQGIDIAAKAQIHALLRDFAARGGGVLLDSSDLSELAHVCDAVLALRKGRIVSRIDRADRLDEERVHAAIAT